MDTLKDHPGKWFIAIKKRGEDIFDLSGLSFIQSSLGFYIADPFIIKKDGENWLFYELYDYKRGILVASKLRDMLLEDTRIVLDLPHHLSFPSVFEDNGKYYMTPEEGKAGRLQLYECEEWPDKWKVVNEIDSGTFGDSTVHKIGSWYYLYTTDSDNHLLIYRTQDLYGKWGKLDAREEMNARSAGHLFEYEGRLVRPTQDGQGQYGSAVIIKELDGRIIRRIEPDFGPNLSGCHTFNFNEDYVVVDGRL